MEGREESRRYAVGEWIVYNATGVCIVEAVGHLAENPAADKGKDYYTLQPLRSRGKIYIPVDSPVYMRPVIDRAAAEALLASAPMLEAPPCITRDLKQIHAHYRALLQTHCCKDLVRLIRSAKAKAKQLQQTGAHLRKLDEDYCRRAEELLYEELSVVLERPYEQMASLVNSAMRGK